MREGPDLAALLSVLFTTGPVVGLRVEDVDATRERMVAEGIEMLTEVERTPELRGAISARPTVPSSRSSVHRS